MHLESDPTYSFLKLFSRFLGHLTHLIPFILNSHSSFTRSLALHSIFPLSWGYFIQSHDLKMIIYIVMTPKSVSFTWTSLGCSRFLYTNVYSTFLLGENRLIISTKTPLPKLSPFSVEHLGQIVFYKDSCTKILIPFPMLLLQCGEHCSHWKVGSVFSLLGSGQGLWLPWSMEYRGNDATWLLRLGHGKCRASSTWLSFSQDAHLFKPNTML